ncbi:unnamed protein product [marine sediment metagenome]|uniref:Uncharacterized protein n=1 Tax=marine sediment metagenome TaxID=412755 RepID=X1F0J8_9ZZZZ
MIWEVKADFFFDDEDEAKDFYHDCEMAFPKTRTINPDQPDAEPSHAELIENHHEEHPHTSCILLESIESSPPPP